MTDLSELLKVISDPKESEARLKKLEEKTQEVNELLADLDKAQDEVARERMALAKEREAFRKDQKEAADLRAEAQKLIDHHSVLGGELEAKAVRLDQRAEALGEREAQLSVQVREAHERTQQSLATAEKTSRLEADLRRRLALLAEAAKGLPPP